MAINIIKVILKKCILNKPIKKMFIRMTYLINSIIRFIYLL